MALKENIIFYTIKSLRPKQWTKNLFIFAAILFSQNIFNFSMLWKATLTFILFCLLSSSVYLINDIIDIDKDKKHPKKKDRPIASGKMPVWLAGVIAFVLSAFSIIASFKLGYYTGIVTLTYFLQAIFYSLYFKNIMILDVLFIAFGFVLRVIVGGVVINVSVSVWLLICITLLALFLALCKRRHEINLLNNNAANHRNILSNYSVELLDQMISIVTSSTLVVYSLYTFLSTTDKSLMLTIPFVLYGIFRYLYLVYNKNGGGEPEEILIKDKPMILNLLLWILVVYIVLYIKI